MIVAADRGARLVIPSIARLRAARTALLLLSIVLLGGAALTGTMPQPVAKIAVQPAGDNAWIVTPQLAARRQSSDVVMSLAVTAGESLMPTYTTITECETGWETFGDSTSCRVAPIQVTQDAIETGSIALGRVTTLDAGDWASYLVEVDPVLEVPNNSSLVLHANVTPCGAPPADQLWVIDHTRPAAQANTLSALEQCGSLPAPLLPMGAVVYAATMVVAVVARRWAWS